jgi:mannose-6-phosphate isomerase-like protein (cupin superfamily)
MTFTYPHTIDNGHGERLTFVRRVGTPDGDRLEVENLVKPNSGPPMHVHHYQDEGLTVVRGRMAYRIAGEPVQYLEPGQSAVFKAGVVHKFWNPGTEDLVCTGFVTPADNLEYFLAEMYATTKRNGGRPSPFDAAFLATRYASEFGIREVPAAVQRVVFPLTVAVGRLLGKYDRYADAPEPVVR